MSQIAASPPRLSSILRAAWRDAPTGVRLGLVGMLGSWFLIAALQTWDVRGRSGAGAFAELASVLVGSCGAFVLFGASVLDAAGARGARTARQEQAAELREMLLALPVVSFVASVLLALAMGMAIVRIRLGGWPGIMGLLVFGAMLVLCGRVIGEASRSLWLLARSQGEAAARAEAQAVEARLTALQSQLHPHFLFNALNTVAALVRTDAQAAERCVEGLASLLRRTLERTTEGTVRDEMEYLRDYLEVEKARFEDRLAVSFRVDPDVLDAELPPMTLQPLVENAIRHGVGSRIEGGRLTVAAARAGGALRLAVEDDGAGFPEDVAEGVGLSNLRQRLLARYGEQAALRLERLAPGSRVVVELPFRGRA